MKGWRTLLVNLGIAVGGVIVAFNWGDALPAKYSIIVTTVLIPVINAWLRTITNTPVGVGK